MACWPALACHAEGMAHSVRAYHAPPAPLPCARTLAARRAGARRGCSARAGAAGRHHGRLRAADPAHHPRHHQGDPGAAAALPGWCTATGAAAKLAMTLPGPLCWAAGQHPVWAGRGRRAPGGRRARCRVQRGRGAVRAGPGDSGGRKRHQPVGCVRRRRATGTPAEPRGPAGLPRAPPVQRLCPPPRHPTAPQAGSASGWRWRAARMPRCPGAWALCCWTIRWQVGGRRRTGPSMRAGCVWRRWFGFGPTPASATTTCADRHTPPTHQAWTPRRQSSFSSA